MEKSFKIPPKLWKRIERYLEDKEMKFTEFARTAFDKYLIYEGYRDKEED